MSVLRFGEFELDRSIPELRRRGRRVQLQEVPLRTLEMLVERPSELVTRDLLFARLWPHDDSGILDDNLNTAVRKLRLALNDSAHHPRYIETVKKRGYRFVAPVRSEDAGAEAAVGVTPDRTPPGLRRLAPPVAVISLIVLAVIVLAVIAGAVVTRMAGDAPGKQDAATREPFRSLAVMPFINAAPDDDDDYFSAGLAEELMDRLSRHDKLRVVSRTSAYALQGRDLGASEIGRLLNAESLLEGSVRRDGDRLRISVRLVDARNGYQLWSETYDRRLDDVFAVQEEIAHAIADTLTGELLGPRDKQALAVAVTDPAAYDLYLRGRFQWHRRTEQGLRSAAAHFDSATRRAPDYAPAWAGLADAWAVLGFYDYVAPEQAFVRAAAAARRALEIEPGNASAYATLGYAALYYDWDLVTAEAHFRRSISLRPDYSKARQWYANLLTAAGRFEEAEQEMRRAQQLDPLSLIANVALGWVRYHAGRYEAALAQFELTHELDADFELAYLWGGLALEALGRYDEALDSLREAVERSGGSGISQAALARLQALRGEREEAERILGELGRSDGYVPAYEIAKAWFALDDAALANEWLQRAWEERSHSLVFLGVDPQLASVRDNAAFASLEARVRSGR